MVPVEDPFVYNELFPNFCFPVWNNIFIIISYVFKDAMIRKYLCGSFW